METQIKRADIQLGGMSCASCAMTIENALKGLDGVLTASVNFAASKATVEYNAEKVTLQDMENAIKEVGIQGIEGHCYP